LPSETVKVDVETIKVDAIEDVMFPFVDFVIFHKELKQFDAFNKNLCSIETI
jgi:hypothetical protein